MAIASWSPWLATTPRQWQRGVDHRLGRMGERPRIYGQQFRARFIRTAAPSPIEEIEKYLGSGMIRGIGLCGKE